jgi:trehalose 6-phosphate synthase/phosphatase
VSAGDIVIVSNRLPVRVVETDGAPRLEPSDGGLVSALTGIEAGRGWVGWPGAVVAPEHEEEVTRTLAADGLYPVFLDADEIDGYYDRVCNETLWPLFHYFVGRLSVSEGAWERYVAVNRRFAEATLRVAGPRTRVWVHDFHLMLVPAMLRAARPGLPIGFFLHIPFPSSEVYRMLPAREAILDGLLGADYIAFQTGDDRRHFRSACLRVLGLDSSHDSLEADNRTVGLGVQPIGIDVAGFRETAAEPETADALAELDERYAGRTLVLGVERLDYSKGIDQKLHAFERFLEHDPERAETTTMLQVVVPSRLDSEQYREQRDEIERRIAAINGQFGRPGITPIEYLHRRVSREELVALYRRADLLLITSLRDGMNLVAQEFAFCQAVAGLPRRWNGALLLSELAGAAKVLPGAILVNPWDIAGTAGRISEALQLDPAERRRRLETMSRRVEELDCVVWAEAFLARLADWNARQSRLPLPSALDDDAQLELAARIGRARRRTLLLDYDGTLRELVAHPALAAPTPEIYRLLDELASLPRTDVHLVSGRDQASMDEWFGALPVWLSAEHGFATRPPGGPWRTLPDVDLSWLPRFADHLHAVSRDVPGTFVELKSSSVVWHYREAEFEYADWRARELLVALEQLRHGVPAEIVLGNRTVEVRPVGVNKGGYVRSLFPEGLRGDHAVVAIGDDRTDRDLYAALPPGGVGIHVGRFQPPGSPAHSLRLPSPAATRRFLSAIAAEAQRPPRAARGRGLTSRRG